MIFANRAMLQSVFLSVLILMGGSSCIELNLIVTNEKQVEGIRKTSDGIEVEVHMVADAFLDSRDASLGVNVVNSILTGSNAVAISNDTPCNTNLKLKGGEVGIFEGPQIIRSRTDLDSLNNRLSGVKVVNEIWWCEGDEDEIWSYVGCEKDKGIVVVRTHPEDPSNEGVLWLHEIGHSFGLEDRDEPLAVMNSIIEPTNTKLNSSECANFQ